MVAQQTPPTHWPLVHWLFAEHGLPFAIVGAQAPPGPQYVPAEQDVAVQLPAQVIPSAAHRLLSHAFVAEAVQLPEPLQTDAVVTLPAVHLAAVHSVALSGKVQAEGFVPPHWALHFPVPPQAGRGVTGSPRTVLHLPTDPASLHDWHWPSQAPSQQTPSTQFPEVHWLAAEQLAPLSSVFVQVPVESQ